MKKIGLIIIGILVISILASCSTNYNKNEESVPAEVLKKGDKITITGIVEYSEEPSDIGEKYCSITGDISIEYVYTDIYDKESKWSSNVFFTKADDTALLQKYVGQKVCVTGVLDTESHGIPYITNIDILK